MTSPVVPSTKGQGQTALADTRASWVNLRSGPGTNYQDIGDIRDGTLVFYYTDTRQGDWVYLEQYGASGWVHTGFVDFKPIEADPPTAPRDATPYDGHVCMWYWEGDSVTEQSIEAVVANVKSQAPQVTQFWLKTSNGHLWQGASDSKKALSVDGPEDIDRWAAILDRYGMELHAWCVPRGSTDIDAEAQVMVQTAQHPAVKSLLLDVEPDRRNYWTGTAAQVRELMLKVRRVIPGDFHIGFVVDPRPWHYETIFPLEWQPFVNSVHPMTYWHTFRITPDEALQQMYGTWLNYGKPIAPIFEVNAPIDEIQQAHSLATARYGARSLSWWRYGIGSTAQMNALSVPIPNSPVEPTPAPTPTPNPGNPEEVDEIIITPDSNRFAKGTYTGREEFKGYVQRMGWPVFYTRTSATASKVWAVWSPQLQQSGEYAVDVYIHKPFSTARNARYKIHGVDGQSQEVLVAVDQRQNTNNWYRLGVYEFDADLPSAGRVFLNDITGNEGNTITFDAVRYRLVRDTSPPPPTTPNPVTTEGVIIVNGQYYADGYDAPVGTASQRAGNQVWPSGWRDASPYAKPYLYSSYLGRYTSVHTGADLNWGSSPYADRGQPIYSVASGIVTFSGERREWGNMVVIQHDPLFSNGRRAASRYAHLDRIDVSVGDRVVRGTQIGTLGGTRGRPGLSWVPHLHVDITPSSTLERNPEDWPPLRFLDKSVSQLTNAEYEAWINITVDTILKTYHDTVGFIRENRPSR